MQDENNATSVETDSYPLDETAIEALMDLERQQQALLIAQQTILNYFARQHKLAGGWQLAENRRELVRRSGNQQLQG
jgi:hypothetical protein